jgi:hypothetical protein
MDGEEPRPLGELVSQLVIAAASAPVIFGMTVLGAGIVFGRRLFKFVSNGTPSPDVEPPPLRGHAGKIRESARAAERAARASGLLSRRGRRSRDG